MRPTYGCPEKFRDSLTTSTAIILNIFMVFFLVDPMNVPTKFEVRSCHAIPLPVAEIIGSTRKIGQSLDTPTLRFLKNFQWAFIRIGSINIPAKFEVRSFTRS